MPYEVMVLPAELGGEARRALKVEMVAAADAVAGGSAAAQVQVRVAEARRGAG